MSQGVSQKIKMFADKASKEHSSRHLGRLGSEQLLLSASEAAGSAKWEKTALESFIYSYLMLQVEPRVSSMQSTCYTTNYTLGAHFLYIFNSLTVLCVYLINFSHFHFSLPSSFSFSYLSH